MLPIGDAPSTIYERFPGGSPKFASRNSRYRVNEKGEIEQLDGFLPVYATKTSRKMESDFDEKSKDYPIETISQAINDASKITKKSVSELESKYSDQLSQDITYNALAQQIANLTSKSQGQQNQAEQTAVPTQLMAANNFGTSDLANKLNFQVSDDQILNDYNNSYTNRLNNIISSGNVQIAGIQDRIATARGLLEQLPANDPRRATSELSIKTLNDDLKSVTDAIATAQDKVKNFTPLTSADSEGKSQITSFREYLQLPEEKATQQLRQIDPESYKTAVGLGRQYRQMATQPIGATTTQQTEDIRNTIEQEALNQLRLGSTIGAEERRGYEQAIRGAQTARGNIFGLGPAVQEAAQIGAAGEQRKLARYGAAQQFLASGQSTGDALRADLAFRDALQQNRLGAAAGFIAGGPSLYNLGQARTANQQAQFQNYINANQAQPGQFATQPYSSQFYQTTNPAIPVQMSGQAAQIYNTMANYQASTYGDYTRAIASQPSGAQQFGAIASGIGSLIPNISI